MSFMDKLNQIFTDIFQVDAATLTRETTADDVSGWDSITHIRLILEVEKVFKIRFRTHEIGKMQNVGDLIDLISTKFES